MSTKEIARRHIQAAQDATTEIDNGGLWRALQRLQDAGRGSNGAGIFCDVSQFKSALREAAAEIKAAQKIMDETCWPTDHEYNIA